MLQPGERVGNYVVDQELGVGGMAVVYRVRHHFLGSTHALKVLLPHLTKRDDVRQRFVAEGRLQAKLRHQNIVPVTDLVAEQVVGLVMDYVEGETLADLIGRTGSPLPSAQVREIFGQVLAGVGWAHRQGVVHRDLKPGNVLLERREGGVIARVADFGLAKAFGEGALRVTATGVAMGTPGYMSPEQVRSPKDVTARSDIFSLGAALYEAATGKLPFEADSLLDLQLKIVGGQFQPPEDVNPRVDPAIAAAIRKALAVDPAQRFATCEEFAQALLAAPDALQDGLATAEGEVDHEDAEDAEDAEEMAGRGSPEGPGDGEGAGSGDPVDWNEYLLAQLQSHIRATGKVTS